MKVLFLDIDGVLNSVRSCTALGDYPHPSNYRERFDLFDIIALRLIQKLCQQTGARVVLSSTWRLGEKHMGGYAKGLGLPVIDRTPQLDGPRGLEIKAWLQQHADVERYAIVDDDGDMLLEQRGNFVQTDAREGLSWDNYEHLLAILGEKVPA